MTVTAADGARTHVVSGAASGIGAATTAMLRERGHRVITIDREQVRGRAHAGCHVRADLATPAGRAAAVAGVQDRTDVVHGLVPAAGLAGLSGDDPALLVSVNYFGALGLVRGLRRELAAAAGGAGRGGSTTVHPPPAGGSPTGASVVLLASNSITGMPGWTASVAALCLRDDEPAARAAAAEVEAVTVYPATKAALAWWARREGVRPEWIGRGIRINAVAPGMVDTPMTDRLAADPVLGPLGASYPSALGRSGRPEEIAELVCFLLSDASSLMVGSVVFADGGTDAMLHPISPEGWEVGPLDLDG